MRLLKPLITTAIAVALFALPAGALAKPRDRDHDRMPDKWEKRHHLNVRANDARKDPDKDGLSNLSEFRHGTNPQKADTDGDGVDDQNEIEDHTNPLRQDSNGDGTGDAEEVAGTITAFDNGVLTIQLPADGAGTVSGTVNDQTQIECDDDSTSTSTTTASASDDGSDDSSESGSGDSGSTQTGSGDSGSTQSGSSDDGASHDTGDDSSESACTSADLKPGARVHEAKLTTATDGSNVFTKIELVPAA